MRWTAVFLLPALLMTTSCDSGAGIDLDRLPLGEPALQPNQFVNLRLRAFGQMNDNGPLHDCDLDVVWDSLPANGISGDSYRAHASVSVWGTDVQARASRDLVGLRIAVSQASGDSVRISLRGPFQTTLFAARSPGGTGYHGQWRCPFDFPSAYDRAVRDAGFTPMAAKQGNFTFGPLPPPPSAPPHER